MILRILAALSFALPLAAGLADSVAEQVRQAGLDPQACYRVRDLRFARDEIKLYFTDGFLIFGKPINGTRISAVFSADVEGGDAELLLLPPLARERKTLAFYSKSPNLVEHFKLSALVFSDNTAEELMRSIQEAGAKPSPEMGALLSEKYNSMNASLTGSFEVRLVEDLLSSRRAERGFLFTAIAGNTLGSFDLVWDPIARQQILMGQLTFRENRRFFDIWTNFPAQSWRMGRRKTAVDDFRIESVSIKANIERDLAMKATTILKITPAHDERIIALDLSPRMTVNEVRVNGAAGEWYAPESLRANLLRGSDNQMTLISAPAGFKAGVPTEIEVVHEGTVIAATEEKIYYVGARGGWYPNRSRQFALYDVTFRFPKELDLVATGELVNEATEGEWKISRRRTSTPVRFFGFNLGEYERTTVKRGALTVEVCANQRLERALQPKPRPVEMTPLPTPGFPRNRRPPTTADVVMLPAPLPNPASRLQKLADEMAGIFDDLATRFGPPPLKHLTVSPIPGRFGQGFPGLVYLSTVAYLDPREMPPSLNAAADQTFFSELLHAHEIAHQWWGNGVTSAEYQDDWLMEALANYSALWMLERRKGARALDQVLDQYKSNLVKKLEDGRPVESAGPVTMGSRLFSSQFPGAWSVITYQKGAWILHMLRRRLGDAGFQKLLAQLYEQHKFQSVTTAQFQALASAQLPPGSPDPKLETFFEQWVDGTGVPELKLSWKVSGRAPKLVLNGTLTQSEVDEEFTTWVPVEIQVPRSKPIVRWVQSSSQPVTFTVPLAAPPSKVTLNPANSILTR